jgi:hypothetical protein
MLIATVCIMAAVGWAAVSTMRMHWLRSTARAVAEQVVAFRSWVAGPGAVWVNSLQPAAPDFLEQKICGDTRFYSKNPALATRELSDLIAKSAVHATFRVVSDNYRNPQNAPDPYEASALFKIKSSTINPPAGRIEFVDKVEGSTYRYSIPIRISDSCLACHGSAKDAPKEIIQKYGSYRAFGYKTGDIRGIITVNLPLVPLLPASPIVLAALLGVLGLVLLADVVLFRRVVVERIEKSRATAQRITRGNYDPDMTQGLKKGSSDEIDELDESLDQLRRNMKDAGEKGRE